MIDASLATLLWFLDEYALNDLPDGDFSLLSAPALPASNGVKVTQQVLPGGRYRTLVSNENIPNINFELVCHNESGMEKLESLFLDGEEFTLVGCDRNSGREIRNTRFSGCRIAQLPTAQVNEGQSFTLTITCGGSAFEAMSRMRGS